MLLTFSIVIPSYNRPARLTACLDSLAALRYPKEAYEVVVVDDGSPVVLEPIVMKYARQMGVRCLTQVNSGPAGARNRGAREALNEYVAFTDDDCRPDPDWLSELARGLESEPSSAIGGRVINSLRDNMFAEASQLLVDYLYDYFRPGQKSTGFFTSNNLAMRRQTLLDLGAFNTSFPLAAGEDRELCHRWLSRGLPLRYLPEAIVYHEHNLTLSSFWRQHFNYGRGAFQFHTIRAREAALSRIKVEPLAFYRKLLAYPLQKQKGLAALQTVALFFLSQVANVMGFFWQRTFSRPLLEAGAGR